jgi:hypothetical protein
MKNKDIVYSAAAGMALLNFSVNNAAAIMIGNSRQFLADPDAEPKTVPLKGYRGYVPWGADDDIPQKVVGKIQSQVDLSSNINFNICAGYGDGIMAVKKVIKNNKLFFEPVINNADINDFFDNNDIDGYLLEQLNDINYFGNAFSEVLLNKEAKRKIVELSHKEAAFSRWEEMNPKNGLIENHFYSAKFYATEQPTEEDIVATPVLSRKNPSLDLLRRVGREPWPDGKTRTENKFRYIIPVEFPTPGRFYYQRPAFYSLFDSGWYDFALLIPEFKKALLNNQMTIKYMVYINEKYFPAIFAEEGIKGKEAERKRILAEYENIKSFLAGAANSGKATFGKIKYTPDGKEEPMIKIIPLENLFKGGEYIEDSEEVANIIAYGTQVHSSLIGSHGKSKTINGTEARELFIIKQAMLKPIRDRLMKPLYVVKKINGWPEDVFFTIPNMTLTTLDKNPDGAVKTTGGQEI